MPYPFAGGSGLSAAISEKVLVTGGFGLVGSQTVRRLAADGHRVIATDLGTPDPRKAAGALPAGVEACWADLTHPAEADRLVAETSPSVIIHLAAVIPPAIYRMPALGRRVNVDATVALLRAGEAHQHPVRFVQASSNAVYGARNPHRRHELLRADSPLNPADLYGAHKAGVEHHLRASGLEWVILRLGGVIRVEPTAMPFSADALFFESALPTDGRIHTVDVRDVASAFAAATTADVTGETLLIAGDESHSAKARRYRQGAGRRQGSGRRVARWPPGRPRQRPELVRHRLDGYHPRLADVAFPAPLLAGHARRDVCRRVAALPDAVGFASGSGSAQTPCGLPGCAWNVCRPVGRGPGEARRAAA